MTAHTLFRMAITREPVVIPTRLEWLALLLMIGIFGFLAQVGTFLCDFFSFANHVLTDLFLLRFFSQWAFSARRQEGVLWRFMYRYFLKCYLTTK